MASASHRGAAASLPDQSVLHGGFRCNTYRFGCKHCPSECQPETSTHFESTSVLHLGAAAASLLDESELHGGFRWKGNHLHLLVPVHGSKQSPHECQQQRWSRTVRVVYVP